MTVDRTLKLTQQLDDLGVIERQNLRHEDAASVIRWVHPEIGVEESCPCETSGRAAALNRLTVDEKIKSEPVGRGRLEVDDVPIIPRAGSRLTRPPIAAPNPIC